MSTSSKEELIEIEGKIIDVLTGGKYKIQINLKQDEKHSDKDKSKEHIVIAYLSGKMKKFKIKIVKGDNVTVAVSPYDLTQGIIKYRAK